MHFFPFIWLLFNSRIGQIILAVLIGFFLIYMLGWWLVPIIAALIALFLLMDYVFTPKCDKKKTVNRVELATGIFFSVFATVWGCLMPDMFSMDEYGGHNLGNDEIYEVRVDTLGYEPDSIAMDSGNTESVKAEPVKTHSYSSSVSRSYYDDDDDDEMRGFDPASEDDMDENGIDRYMENNDEEGWE